MKMKKLLGLLLMGAAMFSSCGNDHEDLYDPNAAALLKANEYSKAFIKEFGKIDPNHTWGFGEALGSRASEPVAADNPQNFSDVILPDALSKSEIDMVTEWFSTHKNPNSLSVNWSDFWVQQVSSLENSIYMNSLGANGNHIDSFNGGKFSRSNTTAMYMINNGSSYFSYQNSGMSSWVDDKFTIQCINGEYYVGFDFEFPEKDIMADGYYNDWIVKIVPGEYQKSYRIIAEDLGDSDDFDFNDVVFDVAFNGGGAVVILQAAGGTLPLFINDIEVHEAFGVPVKTIVNTGLGESKEKVIFRIPDVWNLNGIKLTVDNQEVGVYQLNTEVGSAPQMICVDTDFDWPAERENIGTKYSNFSEYVQNQAIAWY